MLFLHFKNLLNHTLIKLVSPSINLHVRLSTCVSFSNRMNPAQLQILEQYGCSIPTEAPPEVQIDVPQIIPTDKNFSYFNTQPLKEASSTTSLNKSRKSVYIHVRQYCLNSDKTEKRGEIVQDQYESIKKVLKEGSLEDIKELYKKRHIWRNLAHDVRKDDYPICKVESCIHIALPGSEYCANHILLDPNQKLFIECPTCKRPYPKNGECMTCN